MADKPLYQSAPATDDQPDGPSAKIAHPLPGFAPEDDVAPDQFEWQAAPIVFDDTHSVFNRFNRVARGAVTGAFGAPVDLVNDFIRFHAPELASEEPLGGSESLNRLFSLFNFSDEPDVATQEDIETLEGRVGQFVGFGASFLLPLGGAAKGATQVLKGTRPPPTSITGRIVHDMAEQAFIRGGARAPFTRTLLREGTAATLAGAGGQLVFQQFPDSKAAIILGEIIGGMTPAGVVAATKLSLTAVGGRMAKRAILKTFTKEGGRQRAEKRVETVVRDKDKALEGLRQEGEVLEEAALTPAQQTGDVGLLSLEKSVINSSEKLKATADEQITKAVEVIQKTVLEAGKGVPTATTVEVLERARSHLVDLMNVRMQIAARAAEEQIAAIGPGVTRNEANLIVKKAIDDALDDANEQLGELFNLVPLEVVVPVAGSRAFFTELVKKTPLAQREDIPAVAARLLKAKSKEAQEMDALFAEAEAAFGIEREAIAPFGDAVPVAELQGLRSKLLEEARQARSAGQFNKARLADDIAEAVLEDMGAAREAVTGPAGEKLRMALDFTKDVKDRFNKGTIRKLLKPDRQGGDTIPAPLTLEATVARGGPKAKVELDALTKAMRVENPKTGKVMGDEPKMRQAVEDFLLDEFQREVLPQGVIKRTAADTYMSRFQDILNDFPGLRDRLTKAIQANDASLALRAEAEGITKRLNDPKVSRAAVFLREPVDDAMKRISKHSEPEAVMKELIKEAGRDPTGDALLGLKTGFGEFLLNQARTISSDTLTFSAGKPTLKKLLSSGSSSKMAKTLFSKEELKRFDQAAETAARVEKAIRATARPEGILSDKPSVLFGVIAKVTGAQVGRKVAVLTGGGTVQTPGIFSNLFSTGLTKRIQDPAQRLLMDAIQDKELFQALLDPIQGGVVSAATRRQLNLWAIGVARESLPELDEEDLALLDGVPTAQPLIPDDAEISAGEEEEETDGGASQIKAKEGVDLTTLQPEAQSAAETAQTVFAEFGVEAVVTSTTEGKHKEGSKHDTGQAIDLRTRDFPKGKLKEVVESLAASLGEDYDVVLEKDHIHVEFDPKGTE